MSMENMPKLGFGLMRLPEVDGKIDMEQVCEMVDAYMASGMNYFDTAYVYHGGMSERIVKDAIVARYPRELYGSDQAAGLGAEFEGRCREGIQ